MKRWLGVVVLTAGLGPLAQADTTILTLNPAGGVVSGPPGATVGWGFEIYDDTYYLVVAATGFCASFNTASDTLPCQNPINPPVAGGTYTDYFTNPPYSFIDSAPGSPDTSQSTFDPVAQTGTGAFTINNDPTLIGQTLSGYIAVLYNLYSCDPNVCGNYVEETNPANNSLDFYAAAPASVDVVPEPAALALTGPALLLVFLRWKRRRA
jgi:hypothetical protein